jgi:hypothetical protein
MNYKLVITKKPAYLHVTVEGQNSRENVSGYLHEVLRHCIQHKCTRVLIEERLAGPRLETLDVFQIAAEASAETIGKIEAIAYVDINARGDMMHFAETVAVNRALPVKVFPTVAAAEKWLLENN